MFKVIVAVNHTGREYTEYVHAFPTVGNRMCLSNGDSFRVIDVCIYGYAYSDRNDSHAGRVEVVSI